MAELAETTPETAEEGGNAVSSGLIADIAHLYFSPRTLFDYLPRCNRLTGAMVVLLVVESLCGWAAFTTRVMQFEIDGKTYHDVAVFQKQHEGDEEFEIVTAGTDSLFKGGEFSKQLLRVWLVLGRPALNIALIGMLAGTWFVIVALTVGKPNYQLLAGVVAFAWLVEIPELMLRVYLLRATEASRVETSLAAFATGPEIGLAGYILLRRLNPFVLWFWSLIGLGIWRSGQMGGRKVILWTLFLALLCGVLAAGFDVAELADLSSLSAGGG